jgi:hypothetical protein
MFFAHARVPAEGGRKITLMQTPLILLLELLIIALLVLAAADPRAITGEERMPLAIILDDSFSMSAGQNESPKERALTFLEKFLFNKNIYRISLIKAGVKPEFIGRRDMLPVEAAQLISNWSCESPTSNLSGAIKLVAESFSGDIRQIVVTDNTTEEELAENISWYSFGESVDNLAITGASRYAYGNVDRCFFEFSNFSSQTKKLNAEILNETKSEIIQKVILNIPEGGVRRVRFSFPETGSIISANIKDDPTQFDNKAWLMPVRKPKIKIGFSDVDSKLKQIFVKTIEALENARIVDSKPDIVFSSKIDADDMNLAGWKFIVHQSENPVLARGMVAQEKTHLVCEGLPEARAIWAIDVDAKNRGYPLLSLDNHYLLSFIKNSQNRITFVLNYSYEYSNLHRSPFWPVLFWNIFAWRQSFNPGPEDFNLRSGMEVNVNLPEDNLKLVYPDNSSEDIPVWAGKSSFILNSVGLHKLVSDKSSWPIAVNLLSSQESNLSSRLSSAPDNVERFSELVLHSSDVRWWFILPAMLLLLWHQWLINRRKSGNVY